MGLATGRIKADRLQAVKLWPQTDRRRQTSGAFRSPPPGCLLGENRKSLVLSAFVLLLLFEGSLRVGLSPVCLT